MSNDVHDEAVLPVPTEPGASRRTVLSLIPAALLAGWSQLAGGAGVSPKWRARGRDTSEARGCTRGPECGRTADGTASSVSCPVYTYTYYDSAGRARPMMEDSPFQKAPEAWGQIAAKG